MSVSDVRREFYRVMRNPSKDVQRVINMEWRKIDLHQIMIGSVDEKIVLYVG